MMSKRYREALERVVCVPPEGVDGLPDCGGGLGAADLPPSGFVWRGKEYRVLQVLGHWREDSGWWRGSDGQSVPIEQSDLWRVEARNGVPTRGVYELVRKGETWRLDRVWD
ncbi:MAG: hypothetical protein ACI867_000563 [Glaciecola sp.]|jgi:hypothetical protein